MVLKREGDARESLAFCLTHPFHYCVRLMTSLLLSHEKPALASSLISQFMCPYGRTISCCSLREFINSNLCCGQSACLPASLASRLLPVALACARQQLRLHRAFICLQLSATVSHSISRSCCQLSLSLSCMSASRQKRESSPHFFIAAPPIHARLSPAASVLVCCTISIPCASADATFQVFGNR